MENNFEYYLIERKKDRPYLLLDEDPGCVITDFYLHKNNYNRISNPKTVKFVFSQLEQGRIMADYLSQPNSIVSPKIKNVLELMGIKGLQLIPAKITGVDGEAYYDYYYVHIYNRIKAMDRTRSDFEEVDKGLFLIDRFALDKEVLAGIPLEQRRVFVLEEDNVKKLYHKSVMEAIMATDPSGVQFTRVEDWCL